jgi:hypothetical protein
MKNKWWNEPTLLERLNFLWDHPDAINDAFIVIATMICMGMVGFCIAFL